MPLLWRSEFRNRLAGSDYEVDSRRVLELVRDSDCSASDCEFAALAVMLGVKLVTIDGKLLKAFPGHVMRLSRESGSLLQEFAVPIFCEGESQSPGGLRKSGPG